MTQKRMLCVIHRAPTYYMHVVRAAAGVTTPYRDFNDVRSHQQTTTAACSLLNYAELIAAALGARAGRQKRKKDKGK